MACTQLLDQPAKTLLSLGIGSDPKGPTLKPPLDQVSPFLTPVPCLENASLNDRDIHPPFVFCTESSVEPEAARGPVAQPGTTLHVSFIFLLCCL